MAPHGVEPQAKASALWKAQGQGGTTLFRFRWKLFAGFLFVALLVAGTVTGCLIYTQILSLAEFDGFLAAPRVHPDTQSAAQSLVAAQWERLAWSAVFILVVVLVTALAASFFIASRLNRPIRLLEMGMRQVAEGRFDVQLLQLRTYDEFEPLIKQFTCMVQGLAKRQDLENSLEDHRAAEAALVREREQLFSLSLDLICVAGMDGYFKRVNPAFGKVLGHSEADLLARPFIDLVHPDDVAATLAELENLAAGAPTIRFENRYRTRNGGYTHLEWTAAPVPHEKLIYAIARDITDRRRAFQAESALRRSQRQVRLAQEIQESLLPHEVPRLDGYDLAGFSVQAHAVGGDYFDFIPVADGQIVLAIGDASGHGLGAALLMAQTRACLWSLFASPGEPLENVLAQVNRLLHLATPDNRYMTLSLLRLDPETATLVVCNCGHPAAYVFDQSGSRVHKLDSSGLPLGLQSECRVSAETAVHLEPGNTLVLLTDGFAESESPSGEFFGDERIFDVVQRHVEEPVRAIIEALYRAVNEFSEGVIAADDRSVVLLRRLPL